jgi:hypothetical protein
MGIDKWHEVESQLFDGIRHPLAIPLYCNYIDHSRREWYFLQTPPHELLYQRRFGWERIV